MKRTLTLIAVLALTASAGATVTTTKTLVAQSPVLDAAGAVTGWTDTATYPYTTSDERAAIVGGAKDQAKLIGGRLVQVVLTVDDKGTPADDLDDDITTRVTVVLSRAVTTKTVSLPMDSLYKIAAILSSQGQKWADDAAAAIRSVLGLS